MLPSYLAAAKVVGYSITLQEPLLASASPVVLHTRTVMGMIEYLREVSQGSLLRLFANTPVREGLREEGVRNYHPPATVFYHLYLLKRRLIPCLYNTTTFITSMTLSDPGDPHEAQSVRQYLQSILKGHPTQTPFFAIQNSTVPLTIKPYLQDLIIHAFQTAGVILPSKQQCIF
mmetsp:Transcript_4274/g.15385  ORF Transcript_4274/g.15385 Transcript_4274/m.15385 type:complete len:174 (-) Transcript_4274:194-715(-)